MIEELEIARLNFASLSNRVKLIQDYLDRIAKTVYQTCTKDEVKQLEEACKHARRWFDE